MQLFPKMKFKYDAQLKRIVLRFSDIIMSTFLTVLSSIEIQIKAPPSHEQPATCSGDSSEEMSGDWRGAGIHCWYSASFCRVSDGGWWCVLLLLNSPSTVSSIHIQHAPHLHISILLLTSEVNSHSRGVTARQPSTRRTDLIGVDRLLVTSDRDPNNSV